MSDLNRNHPSANPMEGGNPRQPDFLSDNPAPYGAELQQGGVPLYGGSDFLAQGADAPTRVGRPAVAVPQQVNRRTTVAEPETEAPQEQSAPRRRRSRVAERQAAEQAMEAEKPVAPVAPVPPMPAAPIYDAYRVAESETVPPASAPDVRYPSGRAAMPTAHPQRPVAPVGGAEAPYASQQPQVSRPAQSAQPAPQSPQRPVQPAQQRPAEAQDAQPRPQRNMFDSIRRPAATTNRPRYEFEDTDRPEDEDDIEERGHGGVLVTLVVLLLVIGGLLAGICLPDWEGMGGTLGNTIAPIKSTVVSAFNNVKSMILPEEDPIKSFSVTASESNAPAQVLFTVQTAKSVTGIRIEDDKANTVYNALYSAELEQDGQVISNSNVLLWQPSYTLQEAYAGGYTVYALLKSGAYSEGVRAAETVTVFETIPQKPAMQEFTAEWEDERLYFTVTTSPDVTAVRVVDAYNTAVATLYDTDVATAEAGMTEEGDTRVWTLSTDALSYAGTFAAQYLMGADSLNFTSSTLSVKVEPTVTPSPIPSEEATSIPTEAPTVAPTSTPTAAPTATPTPTPSPTPTASPVPTTAPLPAFTAGSTEQTAPEVIGLDATIYENGKTISSYNRTRTLRMLNAFTSSVGGSDYAVWRQAGVLTFRSGPLRQNAAYGSIDMNEDTTRSAEKLTLRWSQPIGSMKVNDGTVYGVAAPGQPVIVKWPTEIRQRMGIYDEMKDVTALKEVAVAAQDGKVHFYNLLTGEATRDDIELGAPSRGGLSVATNGTPILGVGQYNSKLANKSVKNGYHILDLLNNKKLRLIEGDGKDKNSNYSGVTGAALFESTTGTMVVGSLNGVLYFAELGTQKEAYDYSTNKLELGTALQGYKTMAKKQERKKTNIDVSVAMYNNYVYYADDAGVLQCMDANSLTPVWAVRTDSKVAATPALDVGDDDSVALYTANVVQGKNIACTVQRLNALTGETVWSYEVPELSYASGADNGCYASPVVGTDAIDNLVIFTIANGKEGGMVLALDKQTGAVKWKTALETDAISSPVAVYNKDGDAWLVQAEKNGKLHLIDTSVGRIVDTLTLTVPENADVEMTLEASPAVYGNLLVIGSTGRNAGGVYCVAIE